MKRSAVLILLSLTLSVTGLSFTTHAADDAYGPIKSGDSMWRIAAQVRPTGVSIPQAIMVLYHYNPNAFYRCNFNALNIGSTLDVPVPEVFKHLSTTKVAQQFATQQLDWEAFRRGGRLQCAEPTDLRAVAAEFTAQTQGEVTAAEAEAAMEAAMTAGETTEAVTEPADTTTEPESSTIAMMSQDSPAPDEESTALPMPTLPTADNSETTLTAVPEELPTTATVAAETTDTITPAEPIQIAEVNRPEPELTTEPVLTAQPVTEVSETAAPATSSDNTEPMAENMSEPATDTAATAEPETAPPDAQIMPQTTALESPASSTETPATTETAKPVETTETTEPPSTMEMPSATPETIAGDEMDTQPSATDPITTVEVDLTDEATQVEDANLPAEENAELSRFTVPTHLLDDTWANKHFRYMVWFILGTIIFSFILGFIIRHVG